MSQMFLNVVSTFKGDGLAAATRQLGAFGSAAGGLGSTLGKVGAALATFGVATKAIQFTQSSIESARDLERNLFSVNTIFDELSPTMVQFTKDAENIGLSQKDAAKAVTFLGSVLKQSGFAMGDVVTESQKLVSLGVDLAATYGYDVQEALLGMTALFRGEYDPIEKFGVAMKQSEINAELAARKLNNLTGAARRNAEQVIRMELLYERAADATGAFTDQSGNLFVEQKKLSAAFENMQAAVGTALLPAMGELVESLKPLVEQLTPRLIQVVSDAGPAIQIFTDFLKDLGDETTKTSQVVGHFADSAGTIFRLIAENFGTILQLTALLAGLRIAFVLLTAVMNATPIGFTLTALGLLAGGFILVADAAEKAKINNRELNKQWADNPWQQAINPSRVYTGILSDVIRKDLDPHTKNIRQIESAWNSAKAAAFDYSTVGRTAATSRPLKGGKQAEEFFAAQDLELGITETDGTKGGAAAKPKALQGLPQIIADAKKNEKVLKKQVALGGKGLSEEVAKWITSSNKPVVAANQALRRIAKNGDKAIKNLTKNYQNSAAGQQAAAAAFAEAEADRLETERENKRIADELLEAERARLAEQERVYQSFLDSVKNTFAGIKNAIMGAFDVTGLGGSTNSVLRNMEKMLVRLRSFSGSVKQLATMGLDPALLQQIINMGPMAGARFAANLVAGGAQGLSAINAGFGEFGSLASEIATTGTNAMFGTAAQQSVYNINVSGGVGSGATIGKAIVDAIKAYERTSGAVWQGA
jgi:hypothetical protein